VPSYGQNEEEGLLSKVVKPSVDSPWYDKLKIDGYMQFRYNDLYKSNPDMESPQGDATYGGYRGFFIRRMRLKVSGQLHPRLFFYFQADFASDGKNLGQLRDAYFDYFLDRKGTFRFRAGQSKIPYGFENMQSSQNRIPLDRNDPINSALKDERDLSVSIHWAPVEIRKRFKQLGNRLLKGTGDYGALSLTLFNGQKANELIPDIKKNKHLCLRATWPFLLPSGQFIEGSIQGYKGRYVTKLVSDGVYVKGVTDEDGNPVSALNYLFKDERYGFTFFLYPQPFGLLAEFNAGIGPEYDPGTNTIGEENLKGGSLQMMYHQKIKSQHLIPFTRLQYYDGGKKFEQDARSYTVKELEIGVEWQPIPAFELVANYTIANRRYEDSLNPVNRQEGQLIRLQLQVNY